MRRATLAGLVICVACERPEQLLRVSGRVLMPDGPVMLEHDQGMAPTGCTVFTPLDRVELSSDSSFDFDVPRSETLGPFGTLRCFRVETVGPNGEQAQLTWAPMAHDIGLPTLVGGTEKGPRVQQSGSCTGPGFPCGSYAFPTLPPGSAIDEDGGLSFSPTAVSVDMLDSDGGVMWREHVPYDANPIDVNGAWDPADFEDRPNVTLRGARFATAQSFQRDRLGNAVQLAVEYRALTPVGQIANENPAVAVSRGSPCGDGGVCPFTDGDFAQVDLAPGTTDVTLAIKQPGGSTYVVKVRGLWVEQPFTRYQLSGTDDLAVPFASLNRTDVTPDVIALGRNGLESDARLDVTFHCDPKRYLRLEVLAADGGSVPITRLAEISVFQ